MARIIKDKGLARNLGNRIWVQKEGKGNNRIGYLGYKPHNFAAYTFNKKSIRRILKEGDIVTIRTGTAEERNLRFTPYVYAGKGK